MRKDFFDEPCEFGIYPEVGEVSVRLFFDQEKLRNRARRLIQERLRNFVYAYDETPLSKKIGELLVKQRATLSVAESCTGGLLSSEITRNSGSSQYYRGGIICYSNKVKESGLGVSASLLRQKGAVSKEVARDMARGARKKFNSSYALSITGIAGPSGGSTKKPVGFVYVGVGTPKKIFVKAHCFTGDRIQIQKKAIKKALELLWRHIR